MKPFRLIAVDPGESWCGLAVFDLVGPSLSRPDPAEGYLDSSTRGKIRLAIAITLEPQTLYKYLEDLVPDADHLVVERYSLYPWLAREQGYSELLTAQCVGVVRYIAHKAGVPVTQQDAKINLKQGRANAKKAGFSMVDRALGSGRFRYRGPDFSLPGKPHRRDACAHGVMWATTNSDSPIIRRRRT